MSSEDRPQMTEAQQLDERYGLTPARARAMEYVRHLNLTPQEAAWLMKFNRAYLAKKKQSEAQQSSGAPLTTDEA